ncbi:unnamed protein product [Prunus brigantina]
MRVAGKGASYLSIYAGRKDKGGRENGLIEGLKQYC